MPDREQEARNLLETNGYVVLRAKSYKQAQERQRVADALAAYQAQRVEEVFAWVQRDLVPRERSLVDRLTFVYGVARALGASVEELRGETSDA